MELKVHDLIKISSSADLESDIHAPKWIYEALDRSPWVVVRRSPFLNQRIPVGVRGAIRSQRFAAYLPLRCVREYVTPLQLVESSCWRESACLEGSQAFACLNEIAEYYNQIGIIWGPTGSMGYQLASGMNSIHSDSDIDIAIFAPYPVDYKTVAVWHAFNVQRLTKIDAMLETPLGACSLTEYVQSRSPILLRTVNGPKLVHSPWIFKT